MEPAAATRGGPLPLLASQAQRKEWRAVSEHSFRSNGSEEVERGKLSQSDERTKYEEGAGQLDVNFCSITIDGGDLNEDIAGAQRIHEIARQRMELQELEIELKARAIARQTVLEVQHKYEEEVKEHAEATVQLKGQLHEKELYIRECEMKLEEKERELQALKIDSEAAWAKEDLLREQNNELATFRRERDNSEAERAHHLKQIHDLQEHIQEKETQFLELQEQHRVAQETIIYKDEQLRETQAWVARVQEMDALQSTTNQSLQAELRERTEQFNHYWGLLLRQYVDMERHYVQVIQQLQLELTGSKERSGSHNDDSPIASSNPQQPSTHVQNNGNQFSGSENGVIANSETASNDCFKSEPPLSLAMNLSSKNEHIPGAPMIPSSIFGMGAYAQPSQVNALQSFAMHPQAVPHPVGSAEPHVSQSQLGNFQTGTATPTVQNWQTQLAVSENPDMPNQLYRRQSGPDQNNLQSDAHKSYDHSGNKQVNHSEYGKPDSSQKPDSSPKPMLSDINNESTEDLQVTNEKFLDSSGEQYLLYEESVETVSDDSQYHPSLRVKPSDQDFKSKDDVSAVANNELQDSVLESEPQDDTSLIVSAASTNSQCLNDTSKSNISTSGATSLFAPVKASTPALLDERSLLACIVRAIPLGSNGKIRISTTLPNRLGKMLAPLHWHDYRKQYGKLDDFMNLHPELFVIEGDFIHLRDGAQEIVSANAAAAKFAAAAASASASYLSHSIAVTPIAQGHQQKWYQSADVKCGSANLNNGSSLLVTSRESSNKHLQHLTMQNQQPNNISFDILQGLSNVNILSNLKDTREVNDLSSELKSGPAPGRNVAANGTDVDQAGIAPSQIKGMNRARNGPGGRQQGRTVNNGLIPRR